MGVCEGGKGGRGENVRKRRGGNGREEEKGGCTCRRGWEEVWMWEVGRRKRWVWGEEGE